MADLEHVARWFDGAGKAFDKGRKAFLNEAETQLRSILDKNIVANLPGKDINGTVRSWQAVHRGTLGGYVAIRPKGSAAGAETGDNGPGAVTRYLEDGHAPRRSARGRGVRWEAARLDDRGNAYIPGFKFYSQSTGEIERWAETAAAELRRELQSALEG